MIAAITTLAFVALLVIAVAAEWKSRAMGKILKRDEIEIEQYEVAAAAWFERKTGCPREVTGVHYIKGIKK